VESKDKRLEYGGSLFRCCTENMQYEVGASIEKKIGEWMLRCKKNDVWGMKSGSENAKL
jgi:hypothetical protein